MSESLPDLREAKNRLQEASTYLRIEEIIDRKIELEDLVAQPDFWDDAKSAKKLSQELAEISEDITVYQNLNLKIEDAETLIDLASEEGDNAILSEANQLLHDIEGEFTELELRSLFTGEHDERDAVCHIQ